LSFVQAGREGAGGLQRFVVGVGVTLINGAGGVLDDVGCGELKGTQAGRLFRRQAGRQAGRQASSSSSTISPRHATGRAPDATGKGPATRVSDLTYYFLGTHFLFSLIHSGTQLQV
jgi:hypothetical protein